MSRSNYTRRQAIEDGQLVDVTKVAREVMREIMIPIVVPDTVWRLVCPGGSARTHPDGRPQPPG